MSGLRGRSAVAADHRSVLPLVPGFPWWGAAIVAVVFTALGIAYDAGTDSKTLSGVFAGCYVVGCVVAVLAVRQSGVFTAVIQPPLILFVAVPLAYFVFTGSTFTGIKDTLINCGYPLIERFPLMFFTSATVLLIGMVRWYLGTLAKRDASPDADLAAAAVADLPAEAPTPAAERTPAAAKSSTARRSRRPAAERPARASAATAGAEETPQPRPRRSATSATGRSESASARSSGAAAGSARSRHSRAPETEIIEPVSDRPRRRNTPPVDPPAEPRRRSRATEPREPRTREPREPREPRAREPRAREGREPRERRPLPPLDRRAADRSERYDRPRRERPEPYDRPERVARVERPQRRPRAADYEPFDVDEAPPTSRGNGTHHPISRVRYRGGEEGEERTEHRTRPRRPRHSAPDSWE